MPVADDDPLRDFPDRAIRQTLRHPEHLRDLLRSVVPDLAENFDCARARLLEREFPLEDWHARAADLPFEIPYRLGEEERWALLLVLIEHQSDTDRLMPLRLLLFAVMYWDRQWRDWKALPEPRPRLELRPVLPIVLYTASVPWGSTRTLVDLLGEPKEFHAFAPRWEPLIWNLAERTPEELLASAGDWFKMLAVLRAAEADPATFRDIYTRAVHDLAALGAQEPVRWYDLMKVLLTWVYWRRADAERDPLVAATVASQVDQERQKEIQAMTSKWGPTLFEKALAQGRDEGEAKGQLVMARANLRALVENRFGAIPPTLTQRIEATTDLDRLQAALVQVLHAQSADELLA